MRAALPIVLISAASGERRQQPRPGGGVAGFGPPDLLDWVTAASAKMAARHPEPVAGKPTRDQ